MLLLIFEKHYIFNNQVCNYQRQKKQKLTAKINLKYKLRNNLLIINLLNS